VKHRPEKASAASLLETLDGLGIGYYRTDASATFAAINGAGAAMLGYTPEEMVGSVTTFDTNVDSAYRERLKVQVEREGFARAFVSPTRRKDGSVFYAEWSIRRLTDPAGETEGFEGVFRDVSGQVEDSHRRQALLEELRVAHAHLQTFSKIQEELLSSLGHDLKTPPGIVLGFSELLLRGRYGEVKPEQERALRAVHRNTAQLAEMLDLLLDFSRFLKRIHAGPEEPHAVEPLVSQVLERLGREARARHVRLAPPAFTPAALTSVPAAVLDPLLEHLLRNALLLCREGHDVSVRGDGHEGRATLAVSVPRQIEDRPPLNRLLSVFYVLPPPPPGTSEHEPYRLGFASARYLAHLAGGSMTAHALGDEGVEITLLLPAGRAVQIRKS